MKGKRVGLVMVCVVLAAWAMAAQADPPPPTLWASQTGTAEHERANDIAIDGGGNAWIAGYTKGDLGGPNQGYEDAFIAACDSGGTYQWARQIGTSTIDEAQGIALDAIGNIYITGDTLGDLGGPNQGDLDAFIVKHDSGGTVQWARQIGTSSSDYARGIAVDGSANSHITGYTYGDLGDPNQGEADAFIVKYDSGGTVQWARQIGTGAADRAHGIAVDGAGNSYITGGTYGDLASPSQGGKDAFIAKYDSGGTMQWTCQIGTSSYDVATGIALDGSGNMWIAGGTDGDLGGPNQGARDAFVVKCDSTGAVLWASQIGCAFTDEAYDVAVDGNGNVYITGWTLGELGGPKRGRNDAFVAKFDGNGAVVWIRQIVATGAVNGEGIVVDGSGNSYIAGYTLGDIGGPNQGLSDAFIMAIAPYSATAGDANLDGCVDGLDYVVWSNNYKLSDQWWEEGDFTGEGYVDGLDYVAWSNNYKAGCPGQVPGPSSALVLALGICALRRRRTGQRS